MFTFEQARQIALETIFMTYLDDMERFDAMTPVGEHPLEEE